jgi:hypothetical protein
MGLQSFEQKSMTGPEFKEIVRRIFRLHLSSKEAGALVKYFAERSSSHGNETLAFDQVPCYWQHFVIIIRLSEWCDVFRSTVQNSLSFFCKWE